MLNALIIVSIICWIGGIFINGFTIYNVLLIIPTAMFALRKFDIHVKMSNIVVCEVLFLFFSLMWRLLFHKFSLLKLLLTVIARLVFILIVLYDNTVYVYVSEERKKR